MSQKINYSLLLDEKIRSFNGKKPSLLLHVCCAPCSSYVLEYLSKHFEITLLYFNPNISPESEYNFRLQELHRLTEQMPLDCDVSIIDGRYDPNDFQKISNGLENIVEGGERCFRCYRLRLGETADIAREKGFDFFTTTLSISPYKNAAKLNEIGAQEAERTETQYLFSDFKKKNGYKRSCELSEEYSLYRQDYCGCVFSKKEAEKRKTAKKL